MNQVTTTDIYGAAYLLTHGGKLSEIKVTGSNGRSTVRFIFSGTGIDALDQEYRSGCGMVNVTNFKTSMKYIKDIMFGQLRERRTGECKSVKRPSIGSSKRMTL